MKHRQVYTLILAFVATLQTSYYIKAENFDSCKAKSNDRTGIQIEPVKENNKNEQSRKYTLLSKPELGKALSEIATRLQKKLNCPKEDKRLKKIQYLLMFCYSKFKKMRAEDTDVCEVKRNSKKQTERRKKLIRFQPEMEEALKKIVFELQEELAYSRKNRPLKKNQLLLLSYFLYITSNIKN